MTHETLLAIVTSQTATTGIAPVAGVVARLMALGATLLAAQTALLAASRAEAIELRLDSGLGGRLTAPEMQLCPLMADGVTRLTGCRVW